MSPTIVALLQHWVAARGNRLAPFRSDICPVTLAGAGILGEIFIVQLDDVTDRMPFRVVGRDLSDRFGWEPGGDFLAAWRNGDFDRTWRDLLRQTFDGYAITGFGPAHEVILLPLLLPGVGVARWVGAVSGSSPELRLQALMREAVGPTGAAALSRPVLRVIDGGRQ